MYVKLPNYLENKKKKVCVFIGNGNNSNKIASHEIYTNKFINK